MTAIAGLWRFDGKPAVDADCARMLAAQQIYGPHDNRQWSEGPIALGRRLFRILPEDSYDRQPLCSADGRLTVVADLRLDNREELTAALALPEAEARHLCDAAILLACLERWGEDAVDRLVGDFTFAQWDAPAQKLLLARDFLGQRPLHYHCGRGFFAFASMPKGLHALADIPYEADEQAVAELVTLLPQWGSRSFFRDVERVEPAEIVTVTPHGVSRRRYWTPQRPAVPPRFREEDFVEGLRHHLDVATKSNLRRAGGPVGAQLSAGFDSAAVTATAARLLAPSDGKLIAFTAVPREGYAGPEPTNRFGNEGPLAALTAAKYPNIEHVLIRTSSVSPLDGFDRAFFLSEQPVLAVSNIGWGLAMSDAARERGVRVMLTGQNGNMTLSYHGLELLPELFRAGQLIRWLREAAALVAKTDMRWRGALARTVGAYVPVPIWQWANETLRKRRQDVLQYTAIRAEKLRELDLFAIAHERRLDLSYRPRKDSFETRLWVLRRIDSGNANKGALAGWGIDYRDPTADKRLVEYCLSIPTDEYLKNGIPRSLAKRAFADRVPQAVLNERKRGYQAADWHETLTASREQIAAELGRLADCPPAERLLDVGRMKRLVANWPTSGWERDDIIQSYRQALLRGVAAGHFLRKASGANR